MVLRRAQAGVRVINCELWSRPTGTCWHPLFQSIYLSNSFRGISEFVLSGFLISEIVTIFAIFGSVTSRKVELLKKFCSNFEIDLRPLKFSPKNLRPFIFLPENLRPLKKHFGLVFPINNVHPLRITEINKCPVELDPHQMK